MSVLGEGKYGIAYMVQRLSDSAGLCAKVRRRFTSLRPTFSSRWTGTPGRAAVGDVGRLVGPSEADPIGRRAVAAAAVCR